MDAIAIVMFIWFGMFPKSFGRHLAEIAEAMKAARK